MIEVWRLVKSKYVESAFDGEGAKLFGGRWNEVGTPMVYTSQSLSLAALEVLVHLDHVSPKFDLSYIKGIIPEKVSVKAVRTSFDSVSDMQSYGSNWAKSLESAVLKVPSVVIPGENNYLLNPLHPDFKKIKIAAPEIFKLDSRIVEKIGGGGGN